MGFSTNRILVNEDELYNSLQALPDVKVVRVSGGKAMCCIVLYYGCIASARWNQHHHHCGSELCPASPAWYARASGPSIGTQSLCTAEPILLLQHCDELPIVQSTGCCRLR